MVSAVVSIKSCLLTCSYCLYPACQKSCPFSEVITFQQGHDCYQQTLADSAVIVTRKLANFKMVEGVSFDGATLFFMLS